MASRRLRKKREDPIVRLALAITTPEQARRGDLRLVDVSNHSDADQRHMVRSGERRTVRRQSHIERIKTKLGLEDQEAAACQWYADTHAARYETLGVTSSYGDHGRGSVADFDHLPKTLEQVSAVYEFNYARAGICPSIRPMFERIVLQQWDVGPGVTTLFRLATRQLVHRLEGYVEL